MPAKKKTSKKSLTYAEAERLVSMYDALRRKLYKISTDEKYYSDVRKYAKSAMNSLEKMAFEQPSYSQNVWIFA